MGGARACAAAALGLTLLVGTAAPALGDQGWVRGEIRLNVRTGPGTDYRILDTVKTGDPVEIIERAEDWTKVRIAGEGDDREGWIPAGYLRPEPPPTVQLEEANERAATLERRVETLQREVTRLRADNGVLTTQDGEQQAKIRELTLENAELRAGARYPEMIAGALILAAGMAFGALLRGRARRQQARIRL